MAAFPPVCEFGWSAPGFSLPGVDARRWTLAQVTGHGGTLVLFIWKHCPYVQAFLPRLLTAARDLQALGVGVVAISSNDAHAFPQDSFDRMKALATEMEFPFPYLYDEDQSVAKAWGAVCTPDFFGLNASGALQYRGRFDASRKDVAPAGSPCDLLDAMQQVARTGQGPREQIASIGCSIKWKNG